ncbi:unnamed protein product [Blepharisma stoltei]|uniref:Uncharacterized protein n=1 Tax=Blepharisma stoltei TaxID=1481888 RepID=A0AAU9J6T6_9CILI|nr:unnamed protein product [Blepharisma stoltei]
MDFYDALWERALKFRSDSLIQPLEAPVRLPNSYNYQEYTITHKYINSKDAFIAHNLDFTNYHLKVIVCDSYNQAKEIHRIIQPLTPICGELKLVEIKDVFEVYDNDNWLVILVSELVEGISLEQVSGLLRSSSEIDKISKDVCIFAYIWLLDVIESAQQKGIFFNSIFPDSVLLCRGPVSANSVVSTEKYSYNLKVSMTGNYALNCGVSRLDHIYPSPNYRDTLLSDLWGLGLCLYTLCGSGTLEELPTLRDCSDKERQEAIKIRFQDPAIDCILADAFKDSNSKAPFNHPFVKVWRGLWLKDWSMVDSSSIRELFALRSGLFFENIQAQFLALKKVLILGSSHSSEIYDHLSSSHILSDFLQLCMKFDWKGSRNLIDSVFLIMQYKPATHGFQEQLVDIGFLGIIPIAIKRNITPNILYDFAIRFIDDNTLTLLQILWDADVPKRALGGDKIDAGFLKSTIAYYGPNSLDIMKEAMKSEFLNEYRVLQAMLEVPFYFKLERHRDVLELLEKIIAKGKNQSEFIVDILKNTVLILAEILSLPKVLQYHHASGQCTSHSTQQFMCYVGKNPLLIYCIDCNISLCTVCYCAAHAGHNKRFLLYLNPHFRCNCEEEHKVILCDISEFRLPEKNTKRYMISRNGEISLEDHKGIYKSGREKVKITTEKPLVTNWDKNRVGTVIYYEVKILRAGKYEDITIGIDGTGISYKGMNGKIFKGDEEVSLGPRFGSWDIVGIGMTNYKKVYVTYNGLVVHPLISCDPGPELRPIISMGDGCEIQLKLRSWMFQPPESPNQPLFYSEILQESKHLLENLFNLIKKVCRKNNKDRKCQDLIEKFLALLESVNEEKLIQKTRKEIQRTYGGMSS